MSLPKCELDLQIWQLSALIHSSLQAAYAIIQVYMFLYNVNTSSEISELRFQLLDLLYSKIQLGILFFYPHCLVLTVQIASKLSIKREVHVYWNYI